MSRCTLIVVMLCLSSATIRADDNPADIKFHTADTTFPCRDKTPPEFAAANPDRKIVEASIRISAELNIVEGDVDRIEYRLKMPEGFKVLDYLPKITLGSEYAGPIGVGRQDSSKSLTIVSVDAGAKAGFQIQGVVDIGCTVSRGQKDEGAKEIGSSVQMSLLPPKQLISSASTQDAGQTLHFKLKQFNQITLEGDKDFAFLASVPKDWKGECFTLECTAFLKGSSGAALRQNIVLGLYTYGDLATKKRVEVTAKDSSLTSATTRSIAKNALHNNDNTVQKKDNNLTQAVNPFLKKYSGKYIVYMGAFWTWDINLQQDGTWECHAKSSATGDIGRYRGVWSAKDDVLEITMMSGANSVQKVTSGQTAIYSKIIKFDESPRFFRTESAHEFKGQ